MPLHLSTLVRWQSPNVVTGDQDLFATPNGRRAGVSHRFLTIGHLYEQEFIVRTDVGADPQTRVDHTFNEVRRSGESERLSVKVDRSIVPVDWAVFPWQNSGFA